MELENEPWPLKDIEHPLANDVVYGRGGLANNHKGNRRFRAIVSNFKDQYMQCTRHEKTALAESLVRQWRDQTPPGRFVKLNQSTGRWDDVGKKARSKCSQLLREGPLKTEFGEAGPEPKQGGPKDDKPAEVDDVPPPPPPPLLPSPSTEGSQGTPPQKRPSLGNDPVSPASVMDMSFYDVVSVAQAGSRVLSSLKIPGFPRRQKAKRCNSSDTDSSDSPPPAKRPARSTPLASFFNNMLQEKAPHGIKTISILQDNASSSPVSEKQLLVQNEVVESDMPPPPIEADLLTPQPCARPPTPRTQNVMILPSKLAVRPLSPCLQNCAPNERHSSIPSQRKLSSSKRDRSHDVIPIEVCMKRPIGAGDGSEYSVSWKSLDMDFDDDPILNKYASLCESTHHTTGGRSRVSTGIFSVSSHSGIMDNLMEDIGSLNILFRERCDTGNSGISAIDCLDDVRKEWDEQQPALDDMDLDDLSLASSRSFMDQDDIVGNGLDRGTRHTALSIDSLTLHDMLEGV